MTVQTRKGILPHTLLFVCGISLSRLVVIPPPYFSLFFLCSAIKPAVRCRDTRPVHVRTHLTQCIDKMLLKRRPPHKIVKCFFAITY
jgi:hypothetical protein